MIAGARRLARAAFSPVSTGRIGVEMEWLVYRADDPAAVVGAEEVLGAIGSRPLPHGGTVSLEPGGQLELSTLATRSPVELIDRVEGDALELALRLGVRQLRLVALGVDPIRPPLRVLDAPRYRIMEAFFGLHSPSGIEMMTRTAALQINVDFGSSPQRTWANAQAVAPLLGAIFAHSPFRIGRPPTVASQRLGIWSETDPTRTRPVPLGGAEEWSQYALDALLMASDHAGGLEFVDDGRSLLEWLLTAEPGHAGSTVSNHLTTLFPPVRPRRFIELRTIDAIEGDARRAAIAATWALLSNDDAGTLAAAVCPAHDVSWDTMSAEGIADEALREAGARCMAIAADALQQWPDLARLCSAWGARLQAGECLGALEALAARTPEEVVRTAGR